ncbi:MAG: winged helix-turn-helix transcriptional regulator [Thermomicrobiales bacterium]|nr:winged helix-turn-helix transcriptional regulator [Thermomicrobiales bacterium]
MREETTAPNYTALADFRTELRRFLATSADAARSAGIDPTQHQLLLVVKGMEPMQVTIGDLADRLMIKHHSAVELVNRCEQNGWIERHRDDVDRRVVHVRLTAQGETILSDLSTLHMRELQSSGPRLIKALTAILKDNAISGKGDQ